MFSQKGLPKHDVHNWNESDVTWWLKEKGLGRILRRFRDNKVDGKTLLQVSGQYLDELGVVTQSSRDKLLAAIHELKLFGGPLPEEKHFRLNVPGTDDRALREKHKKRSLPARLPDMQHFIQEVLPDLAGQASLPPELRRSSSWKGLDTSEVPGRKTPQEVLQEQTEKRNSISEQHIDTGEVQVYIKGLDEDCKTIEVTSQTTSKDLVRMILEQTGSVFKDPNLFYIAVEIGIKKKDSNLPTSQMMVLANDARPLQIQSSQLSGEAKFHLKMRNGGVVRVQAGVLSPGATYKSMQIARQTRADEVIKMLLSSYGCNEPVEEFVLVESSTDSSVGRVLEREECPLQVQSQWSVGEQNIFTLTRDECKVASQSNGTERKSKGKDAISDNQESPPLQEGFPKEKAERRTNQGKRYVQKKSQQADSSFSDIEKKESIEEIRKRRTSIEALDLQSFSPQTRKGSQIDKFRNKFHEFQRKATVDESVICGESSKKRKVSQIDRFRTKFLAYYSGKMENPGSTNSLNEGVDRYEHIMSDASTQRKTSASSDGEDLRHFSSSLPTLLAANNAISDISYEHVKRENTEDDMNATTSVKSQLSLATILQHSKLYAVTLMREPGEDWGLELVHVTQTGSLMSHKESGQGEEEKVVYVLHNGNGQNSILSNPDFNSDVFTPSSTSTPPSGSSSGSSELEMCSILGCSSHSSADLDSSLDDMRHMVHKQNLKRRIGVSVGSTRDQLSPPDASPLLSRPPSTSLLKPTNHVLQRSSSALAQWRTEGSPHPRHGVRIVGMTGGGVAARSSELAVGDLIVEINGSYVLHSPLELVIDAMQSSLTVTLVVSRTRPPKPKPQEKDKTTDCREDIRTLTLQIQDLITKVTEMQSDITKKDDKIRLLKKLVKKHKEGKSKIQETVHVLV